MHVCEKQPVSEPRYQYIYDENAEQCTRYRDEKDADLHEGLKGFANILHIASTVKMQITLDEN